MKKKTKKSVKRVPVVAKQVKPTRLITVWDMVALVAMLGTVLVLGKLAVDLLGV
jgi:hypothetical protein